MHIAFHTLTVKVFHTLTVKSKPSIGVHMPMDFRCASVLDEVLGILDAGLPTATRRPMSP
jgi:hypothetical protein